MLRQFGLWESPITPLALAQDKRLDAVRYDTDGRTLVWLEGRSGQGVLVAGRPGDAPRDLTSDLSVRAEVGYGGGDYAVHGGTVYFIVHKTGRIYRLDLAGGTARPITPPFGQASSPAVSPDGRFVAYVHHDGDNDRLAVVDAAGRTWPQIVAEGHDFYMQPRWSPDGRRLAWVAWDHPNMPWDGTTLFVAEVDASQDVPRLATPQTAAGGKNVAVFQPEFTPDGRALVYISDASGWGQIVFHPLGEPPRTVTPAEVEYGTPAWLQDMRTFAVGHDGTYVVAAANRQGVMGLERIDVATGSIQKLPVGDEYQEISQVVASPTADRCALLASGPMQPPRVVECDLESGESRVLARASTENVPAAALARCEPISWTTAGGETAHGLYYAPASDRFTSTGNPPLVVLVHGGPTSQVRAGWRADAQFFATRGYALLYVNYRGSTGYGRPYMLRLRENWGVCDVVDSISGAEHLAQSGRCDPERMIIMGGSAGGFTVLQTLVERPEAFAAGVCLYGVSDQFHLAAETHKFESRYTDTLIGPLPEASGRYRARSPAFHARRIKRPLAVFQGAIDTVVPQAQSDAIVEALRETGTSHIYHVYEGEGHGWRKRETIEHFYGAVDAFLRKHVIFS